MYFKRLCAAGDGLAGLRMLLIWLLLLLSARKDHEKAEFEVHEVYAVDVLMSTGEGKVKAPAPASVHQSSEL